MKCNRKWTHTVVRTIPVIGPVTGYPAVLSCMQVQGMLNCLPCRCLCSLNLPTAKNVRTIRVFWHSWAPSWNIVYCPLTNVINPHGWNYYRILIWFCTDRRDKKAHWTSPVVGPGRVHTSMNYMDIIKSRHPFRMT